MFPLSIKLRRRIHLEGEELASGDVRVILAELEKLKVDKIRIEGTYIKFENHLFNKQGRTHLMATVDCGHFEYSNHPRSLIYQFSTKRMFFIALIMCLFFGLIAWSIGVVLFFFAWLYGMNFIIAIIRHRSFLKRLARQIEKRQQGYENRAADRNLKSVNN